ncbi:MAG: LysR family transcriptional regulator [Nitratireductor sp.]|nr:LysR family transcriptional regulator [Nitratireductor sp.]
MELRQIRYFIALYETGSVTKAAHRLNVVQPAVSMQISKLEEELGQVLFERLPKGMAPTAAGEQAYHLLAPIFQEFRSARERIENFGGRVAGQLAVGVIASVSNNALSECLQGFCTRYPDVSMRVTGGYTTDFLDMLQVGQLDIAVINQPRTRSNAPVIELMSERLAVICAPETGRGLRAPLRLQDIAQHKLVIPSARHGLRSILDQAASDAGIRLQPSLEFDELKTIEDFVQRTDFLTILPPIAVHRALRAGSLKAVAIVPEMTREIVCAYSSRRGLSPAGKLFVEELRASMTAAMHFESHQDS